MRARRYEGGYEEDTASEYIRFGETPVGSSENLDATSVLHPADVHAAVDDNAPTTVFSSDETAVLSDYQDATQVLTSHETATPAATHSDDRTKVLTDYGSSPANKTAPAGP